MLHEATAVEPAEPEPVLVQVDYFDPFIEFADGDAAEPNLCSVVGWQLPARFPNHIRIASERSAIGGWRAITHVPVDCVAMLKEVS